MKKIIYTLAIAIGSILIGFSIQSCSNEDGVESRQYISSEEANFIAINHLRLVENKYKLDLTEEDANNKNISPVDFHRMKNEIKSVNQQIENWHTDGIEYHLSEPVLVLKNIESYITPVRLKNGSETSNSREKVLNASGQDWVYGGFFAPSETSNVYISCFGGGLLTAYNVSAKTCGNTISDSGVGLLGTWSTSLSLSCSNTDCTIGFKTSNSNGGGCRYSW